MQGRFLGWASLWGLNVTLEEVQLWLLTRYSGLVVQQTWGETSLFYNPLRTETRGTYTFTLKEKDGPNDKASKLHRPDAFRLNFSLTKPTFTRIFGSLPQRPRAGGVVSGGYDFGSINMLVPHPVYGWSAWAAILNPDESRLEELRPLFDESYTSAQKRFKERKKAA